MSNRFKSLLANAMKELLDFSAAGVIAKALSVSIVGAVIYVAQPTPPHDTLSRPQTAVPSQRIKATATPTPLRAPSAAGGFNEINLAPPPRLADAAVAARPESRSGARPRYDERNEESSTGGSPGARVSEAPASRRDGPQNLRGPQPPPVRPLGAKAAPGAPEEPGFFSRVASNITETFKSIVGRPSPATTANPLPTTYPQSVITVSSLSVASGSSVMVTLTLKDAGGNTVPRGGITVSFSYADGTSTGEFSPVTDHADGTYTATFSGKLAGSAVSISATTGSVAVATPAPSLIVTAGPVAAVAVFAGDAQSDLVGQALAQPFAVVVTDTYGNVISGATVDWAVASGGGSMSAGSSISDTNGQASGILTLGALAGTNTVMATVNGTSLAVVFTAQAASGMPAQLTFNVQPSTMGTAGTALAQQPSVAIQDGNGNLITGSSAPVTLDLYANNTCTVPATTTPNAAASIAGAATVAAASGVATFAGLSVNRSAGSLYFKATSGSLVSACSTAMNVSAGPFSVSQSALTVAAATVVSGSSVTVTLTGLDAYGNPNPSGIVTPAFGSSLIGGSGTYGTVTNVGLGVYTSSFTGVAAGFVTLWATINGGAVTATESVTVSAGSATQLVFKTSPSTTGDADTDLAQQPVVNAKDPAGNLATGYGGAITLTPYSDISCTTAVTGGFSAATNPVTASGGVATFVSARVLKTNVQSIKASDGTLSACFATLVISPGAASTIAIVSGDGQSGVVGSPLTSAFVAVVKDANANVISGVTVNWAVTAGAGSLSSLANVTNGAGLSSSTLTLGALAGTNTARATVDGTAISVAFGANANAGAATQLAFATQPAGTGTAGAALSQQPVVRFLDANSNLVNSTDAVVLDLYSDAACSSAVTTSPNGGSSLGGTVTKAAVGGVSTFTNVAIRQAAATLYLRATSGILADACSSVSNISPGAFSVSESQVTTSAVTLAAGAAMTATLTARDAYGNANPSGITARTFAATSTPGSGSFGTITDAGSGVFTASFTGVNAGLVTISATINATAVTDTADVTVTAGAATHLAFTTQPSSSGTAGAALSQQPVINVLDASDNVVSSTAAIALDLYSDNTCTTAVTATPNAGASTGGTTTKAAVAGVATFTNVEINKAGPSLYFRATSPGLTSACSTSSAISPGVFSLAESTITSAATTVASGSAVTITLTAKDAYGNANPGGITTKAFTATSTAGSGTLGSITNAGSGVFTASFTGVNAGLVTISASINAGAVTDTEDVTVTAGAATRLAFTTQPPATGSAGTALSQQPTVQILDANNNLVSSTAAITLGLYSDNTCSTAVITTPNAGASTGGTLSQSAVAGIAAFTDIQINKSAASLYLRATSSGLTSACSTSSAISPGIFSLAESVLTSAGATVASGSAVTITLTAKDAYGNANPSGITTRAFTATSSAGSGTFGSITNAGSGVFTALFTGANAGLVTISASINASAVTDTEDVTVTAGAATQLAFTTAPSATGTAGTALSQQPVVKAQDASGNVVSSYGAAVELIPYADAACSVSIDTTDGVLNDAWTLRDGNLVGYWKLDGAGNLAGGTSVGNTLGGNGTSFNADGSGLAYASGKINQGLHFDGVDDRIEIPHQPSFNVDSYTVQLWVKLDSFGDTNAYRHLITKGDNATDRTFGLWLEHETNSNIHFSFGDAGGGFVSHTSVGALTIGTWHHVALVHTANTKLELFIDGVLDRSFMTGLTPSTTSVPIQVGGGSYGNTNGTTDEVAIWNTALTASEIKKIYGRQKLDHANIVAAGNPLTASGGVATYAGLKLNDTSIQSLKATDGTLSRCFSSLTIAAAAPALIEIFSGDAQSGAGGATLASAHVAAVKDGYGNAVPSASVNWAVTAGAGSLSSTASTTAANGRASSTLTLGPTAGPQAVTATVNATAISTLFTATATAGAATKLAFATQPSGTGSAGTALSQQPVVQIRDANNNVVNSMAVVALDLYSDNTCSTAVAATPNASASMSGTTTQSAAAGNASFANVEVDKAAGALYLKASSTGLTSTCSAAMNISAGVFSIVDSAVTASAASVASGSTLTAIVTAKDAYGNMNPSGVTTVAFSATTNAGTGTFAAATAAGGGVYEAVFTGALAGSVTLSATLNGGAVSDTETITVVAGAATQLVFTTTPSTTGNTDAALAQQPVVKAQDAAGNVAVAYAGAVALTGYSDTACAVPVGGSVAATANPVTASSGVATYAGVKILKTAVQSIKASDGTLAVCFATLTIGVGAPASLAVVSGNTPTQGAASGAALAAPFIVVLKDANANIISGAQINWAVTAGGGSLAGAASVSTDAGGQSNKTLTVGLGAQTVTATVDGDSSLTVTFTANVTSLPFTKTWTFDTAAAATNYDYDANKIEFVGDLARLKFTDQIDDDNAPTGFGGGTATGISWDGTNNYLRLTQAGTPTNTAELDASWTPRYANVKGYWKLNETSGSTISDSSPNGNHGIKQGGPTLGIPGKLRFGVTFPDSHTSYIDTQFAQSGLPAISWMAWFQTTDDGVILGEANATPGGSPSSYNPFLRVDNSGYLRGYVYDGITIPVEGNISTSRVNDGAWHQAVYISNGSSQLLYLDGVFQASTNFPGGHGINSVIIGTGFTQSWANGNNWWHSFNGNIDEVAVWDVTLTAEEIMNLYSRQSAKYSGTFNSRVMDATAPGLSWTKLLWTPSLPFYKELPDALSGVVQNETSAHYSALVGSSGTAGANDLMTGIIGLWHLNEPVSSTGPGSVKDYSGEGNDGTPSDLKLGSPGRFGTAATFNGSTSYVDVPVASAAVSAAFTEFTVSVWYKNLNGSYAEVVGRGKLNWEFQIWANLRPNLRIAGNNDNIPALNLPVDGDWHHVAATFKDSTNTISYFLDGQPFGSPVVSNDSFNSTVGQPFQIGRRTDGSEYVNGTLDELAIWNRALHPKEIGQLYRRGANRLKHQVRVCTTADCGDDAGGTNWKGPDGTNQSYFSELNNNTVANAMTGTVKSGLPSALFADFASPVGTSQYFQYRSIMESDDTGTGCNYGGGSTWCSPELKRVSVDPIRYDASSPVIIGKGGATYLDLNSFSQALGSGCTGGVTYNLGVGSSYGSAAWYWWNSVSGAWEAANGTVAQSSAASVINTNAPTFHGVAGTGTIFFKAYLNSTGTAACELNTLQVGGNQ